MIEFSPTLLTQPSTGLALALEILNRVFERHAVDLEERVQVVPRRNIEKPAHVDARQAVRSVRVIRERLKCRAGQAAILAGQLFGKRVGHIKPDLHVSHHNAGRAAAHGGEVGDIRGVGCAAQDAREAEETVKVKRPATPGRRRLFSELMEGVDAMRGHREGRITLRTHRVEPVSLPAVSTSIVRATRE